MYPVPANLLVYRKQYMIYLRRVTKFENLQTSQSYYSECFVLSNTEINLIQVYVPQNTTVPQNTSLIYFRYKI